MTIGLSIRDFDWLGSLRSLFKADAQIGFAEISKSSGRMAARLTFSSKQMHARLFELGIKKEPPPNMSLEMSRYFVRGLFDGDGTAFVESREHRLRTGLTGERFICEWVVDRFREFTGLKSKVGPYKKTNTMKVVHLTFSGSSVIPFCEFIYGSMSLPSLERKYFLCKTASPGVRFGVYSG